MGGVRVHNINNLICSQKKVTRFHYINRISQVMLTVDKLVMYKIHRYY